jgi:hypothetical protein
MKACGGGEVNSSLSFHWGQLHVPVSLTTVLIEKDAGWAPKIGLDFSEKISCPFLESNHGPSDVRPAVWSLFRFFWKPQPPYGSKLIPETVTLVWSFLLWDFNRKQVFKSAKKLSLKENTDIAVWKQAYRSVATETAGSTQWGPIFKPCIKFPSPVMTFSFSRFNFQTFCKLTTEWIYVNHVDLKRNNNYFPLQN